MSEASKANGKYYVDNKNEFMGERGHDMVVKKLIDAVEYINNKNVVCIDVGTNVGDEIKFIRMIAPESTRRILTFEPNPVNVKILKNKFTGCSDIILHDEAVSKEKGILPFYIWKDQKENVDGNGLGGLRSGGSFVKNVNVITLDNVLADSKYDNAVIKYIKIDTEGNDTNVLYGLKNNLNRVKYILFEASDCLDDIRGPGESEPLKKCIDYLDANGFDTYRIGEKRMLRINGTDWNPVYEKVKFWSNCFSIKKNDAIITKIINKDGYYL